MYKINILVQCKKDPIHIINKEIIQLRITSSRNMKEQFRKNYKILKYKISSPCF